MTPRVAVIGAGYAGLACAVELVDQGVAVEVFEASRTLGGRARGLDLDGQLRVDNGAHILVGAYRNTLALMQRVGVDAALLHRHPLRLDYPGHLRLSAARLPAPLHLAWALLTARGLSLADKRAAIRFMRWLKKQHYRLAADTTVAALLADQAQPGRVRHFLWEPLCLAALNTPPDIASAQVFLNVLRDSLGADRAAADLLLPGADFSRLFPDPAARHIEKRGGRVLRQTRIERIEKVGAGWMAHGEQRHGPYDHLVLAVAPYHLPRLLRDQPEFVPVRHRVEAFTWQPIVTCYLAYPATVSLAFPMTGLDTRAGGHAQWLFDRGALNGQRGLIAAVISGTGAHAALSHAALGAAIHGEIAQQLPGLPAPLRSWVIEEKRATFSCTPNLSRPATATAFDNVWLAGDYVAGDYPATLEGAVRSGLAAARSILGAGRQQPSAGQA